MLAVITIIMLYENLALQQTINLSNDNLAKISSTLHEYEKSFGNITAGYDPPPLSLDGKIYVMEGIGGANTDTKANDSYTIKTNHMYVIQGHLTRGVDVKPSLLQYVCYIQILNSTNHLVDSVWGDTILIPKYDSSNCALQWSPDKSGNYTAQLYASEDEIGTTPRLSSMPEAHIRVIP